MLSFDFFFSSSHFIVLLLLFGSTMVSGVCTSCYGREPNCSGDTGTCPWNVELAANVAAIVTAGSTATLSVVYQLPVRLMRVFSRAALTVLTSLHRRPKPGEQLNLSKADGTGLTHGIQCGICTRAEALLEISSRYETIDYTKPDHVSKVAALNAQVAVIKEAVEGSASADGLQGAYTFVLARLSKVICVEGDASFELNVEAAFNPTSGDNASSSSSTQSQFSAKLIRPRNFAQVSSLLNLFVLVLCSTGLTTVMLITPFLDELFYEPCRIDELSWWVAFETMLIYLKKIEAHPGRFTFNDVISKVGGLDSNRRLAMQMAEGLYPTCFRTPRGEPRDVNKDGAKDGAKEKKYEGKVEEFNHTSKRGCAAWNNGNKHLAKYVTQGKCQFFHGCDHFVTDKGPGGQCLSQDHTRANCDYDASKKCKFPAK